MISLNSVNVSFITLINLSPCRFMLMSLKISQNNPLTPPIPNLPQPPKQKRKKEKEIERSVDMSSHVIADLLGARIGIAACWFDFHFLHIVHDFLLFFQNAVIFFRLVNLPNYL